MIYLLSSCETIVNKMEMEDVCSSFFFICKEKTKRQCRRCKRERKSATMLIRYWLNIAEIAMSTVSTILTAKKYRRWRYCKVFMSLKTLCWRCKLDFGSTTSTLRCRRCLRQRNTGSVLRSGTRLANAQAEYSP